ncbi:MAG: hypothetical protein ACE14P_08855 [Methanotrichaceae archaeon]
MDLRDVVIALSAAFAIIGMITVGYADDSNILFKEDKDLTLKYDQKASGIGFFSAYKYAFMPDALGPERKLFNGVETKSKAHGSGTIDIDSNMFAESYYLYEYYNDEIFDEEPFDELEDADSIIQLKENGKMTYSPVSIAIDSRYYNLHPVTLNSLLKDDAWVKNRDNLNSMNYLAEGAHKLDRMLDIQSNYAHITMNVDEKLTDGKSHFGVLAFAEVPVEKIPYEDDLEEEMFPLGTAMKEWQKPLAVVDEDYIGTFQIRKNMTLETQYDDIIKREEGWLPCCGSYEGNWGWYDMNATDKKSFGASTKGVFDCTCFKAPDKAQFPR